MISGLLAGLRRLAGLGRLLQQHRPGGLLPEAGRGSEARFPQPDRLHL
eukprot:SAG22_NODE_8896_length_623_cov_0.885496_2_plen_47_part_01